MLAICALCATLSRQELLVALHDEDHHVIKQLMHCFKFKIEVKQFVCSECTNMVQMCDDFFKKIERAQDTLKILFKAKSNLSAEQSSKANAGTIRTRDFCKIQMWEGENIQPTDKKAIEEPQPSCSSSNDINLANVKVEFEENDGETRMDEEIESTTNDAGVPIIRSVESEMVDETVTSDESPFLGFEQVHTDGNPNGGEANKNVSGKIKITTIKFECAKCACHFPSEELLESHLKDHSRNLALKCKECNKIFRYPSALKIHMRSHNSEAKFECKTCLKTFRHASTLWSHTKMHTHGRFKCNLCSKQFFQQENLKSHLAERKCNRAFNCEMCQKAFNSQRKLTKHIDDHHVASVWKCKECPSTFSTLAALNSHMQRFTHNQYTCEICQRNFRSEIWYRSHLRTHSIAALAQARGSTTPIVLEPF